MERKFKENFSDIDEELAWAFIVKGGMNPLALGILVADRNLERAEIKAKQEGRDGK